MRSILPVFILMSIIHSAMALDLHQEINLKGEWLFEIGDNPDFRKPDFNDSKWERIVVPSLWENEGFPGYDGYAWYRIKFTIPAKLSKEKLYLKLGRIDDVDEVYLNGEFIGSTGSFPPNYKTAWNVKRIYALNNKLIRFGQKNTIAVRVLDFGGGGGISDGHIGIFSRSDIIDLAINLKGMWKFIPGDAPSYSQPLFDDSKWQSIQVPANWEDQGFPKLDGIAWYRKKISIPHALQEKKLILLAGKINDIDEVYFNGTLIGRTGEFPKNADNHYGDYKNKYKIERAYFIPPSLIHSGPNTIAIRVLDVGNRGGIYSGYVGITTRDEYLKYSHRKRK